MTPFDEVLSQLPQALEDTFYERVGNEDTKEIIADLASEYISQLLVEKKELLEALEELLLDKHYHTASPDDVDTCAVCGEDFRSNRHLRIDETTYSAREKAQAAIAKAKS